MLQNLYISKKFRFPQIRHIFLKDLLVELISIKSFPNRKKKQEKSSNDVGKNMHEYVPLANAIFLFKYFEDSDVHKRS